MCRSCVRDGNGNVVEGTGRRCPGDSSEARRARRNNARALQKYGASYTSTTPEKIVNSENLNTKTTDVKNSEPQKPTLETIKNKIEQLNELKNFIINRGEYSVPTDFPKTVTLPDGSVAYFHSNQVVNINPAGEEPSSYSAATLTHDNAWLKLIDLAEQQTVEIGADVVSMIEERSGVKTEEIIDSMEEKTKAEKAFNDLCKEIAELIQKRKELEQTHGKPMLQLIDEGNVEAIELKENLDRVKAKKEEQATILQLANTQGTTQGNSLFAKQKEALVGLLAEIRPLGGELTVADTSSKKAVNLLKEAIEIYPTAWIEASNQQAAPRIKITTSRAHYSNGAWQTQYKVVPRTRMLINDRDWQPDPDDPVSALMVKIPDSVGYNETWVNPETGQSYIQQAGDSESSWIRPSIEFAYRHDDPNNPPRGRGWKKLEHNGEVKWYRPMTTRSAIESKVQPELTVSGVGESARRVALHEFAHRIESTPKVGSYIETIEEAFLRRRTTDPETNSREPLKRIYAGRREYGRADNFVNLYMGKEYRDGYREILSTGAEAVFANSYGGLVGLADHKPDLDMRNLIIGLWASA